MTKVAFLGTPRAAVPTLEALAEQVDVRLVITQPDRPRGRSRSPQPSPVKERSSELGLNIQQPEDAKGLFEAIRTVGSLDVAVVVAYGRILRPEVLTLPQMGMLNVHFSLLPRWRGAAPVNRAIMAGDTMTGVTIIKLDEGLDTGPVLTAQAVDIEPSENVGDLELRLSHLGAHLLVDTLPRYLAGNMAPIQQSDDGLTYASKILKDDRILSTDLEPDQFVNTVRGLAPNPGAVLTIDGDPHKIFRARPSNLNVNPGVWVSRDGRPVAGLASGAVELVELQAPGRSRITGEEWLRGRQTLEGSIS